MAIIGIDLGTTYSLCVAYKNDESILIPNEYNEYLTPSVVSITDDDQILVGKAAKDRLVNSPNQTVSLFKRTMGTNTKYSLNAHEFSSEELSSFVVSKLVDDAKKFLNEDIEEIVISVPAYFNNQQRSATRKIGDILNIKIERLVNEPSAAALAVHDFNIDETFIVFDFGGGTLDVSAVDCFDNVISICSIAGDNEIGSSDIDLVIAKDICKTLNIEYDALTKKQQELLLFQTLNIKHNINNQQDYNIIINDIQYSYNITNSKLSAQLQKQLNRIKLVIANCVNNSNFEKNEINKIVLVGGGSKLELISDYLKEILNIEIVKSNQTDYTVALGIGKYIGIKQRNNSIKNYILTDICPFSLSIAVYNESNEVNPYSHVIIPKNTVLPVEKKTNLNSIYPNQQSIKLDIYQGENIYAKENLLLASKNIKLPILNKCIDFELSYIYDINSILCVELTIIDTNEKYSFYVSEDNNLEEISNEKLENIKSNTLSIISVSDIDYIYDRIKRLCEYSNKEQIIYLENKMREFDILILKYSKNIRKKSSLIKRMNDVIDFVENNNNSSIIFEENKDIDISLEYHDESELLS